MNNCSYIWQRAGSIKGRGGVGARSSFISLKLIHPPEIFEIKNTGFRQETFLSSLSRSGLNFMPCRLKRIN